MQAIPPLRPGETERVTGITCPDCPGVLQVSLLDEYVHFRCRIGHTYSLVELIRGKEEQLEDLLWAPVTAFEELAAILTDALEAQLIAPTDGRFAERIALARRQAEALRAIIEHDVVTALAIPGNE